jgi:hypothetical protein
MQRLHEMHLARSRAKRVSTLIAPDRAHLRARTVQIAAHGVEHRLRPVDQWSRHGRPPRGRGRQTQSTTE